MLKRNVPDAFSRVSTNENHSLFSIPSVLVKNIISFVLNNKKESIEQCMKLKEICKFFNAVIKDKMFGSLLHVYDRHYSNKYRTTQEFWHLPYSKVDTIFLKFDTLHELQASMIRECRSMSFSATVSKLSGILSLDFFDKVTTLFLSFFNYDGIVDITEVIVHLPGHVRELYVNAFLPFELAPSSRIRHEMETLQLMSDQLILHSVDLWADFFASHRQTLRTLCVRQGMCPFIDFTSLLTLHGCEIENLTVDFIKPSTYTFDISKYPLLQTVRLDCSKPPDNIQLLLTQKQKDTIKFICRFRCKKVIV